MEEKVRIKSRDKRDTQRAQKRFFFMIKKVGKAVADYKMLAEGDKIAVAVSGGKDSLCLLKILKHRRKFVPIKYSLLAVHIDFGYNKEQTKVIKKYLEDNGYDYIIKKVNLNKGSDKRKDVNCFWCAWNRRKALFETAQEYGCQKLALGHHKDDIIETILLNLFFQASISAMSPYQELFKGRLKIIRPLAYVQEKELKDLAKYMKLPTTTCDCPGKDITKRKKMKEIIRDLQKICPSIKNNIFNAVRNIRHEYLL